MIIRKSYVGKINGLDAVCCDSKPDNMRVTKEVNILYPDEGFMLESKDNETLLPYTILSAIQEKDNYIEVEVLEELNDLGE